MPGFLNDSDIERIRDAVDIAEIIGGYVTLKRKSRGDLWGICPFHGEKSASFHVRSDRGMFHCFGCGKGGNIFTFLMDMEGISFPEAVRSVAERAGITLPERSLSPEAQRSRTERDRLFQANAFAAEWFHKRLIAPHPTAEGAKALEYLRRRGLGEDIIKRFQIGWSESGADELITAASKSGIGGHTLAQAGLAIRRRDGAGFSDRFRCRVMFPIQNLSGKPVAFGGRRIDGVTPDEDEAKYINTSETAAYTKGEHLYGLYAAREAIREAGIACLVEGYTDLLAMVAGGVPNSVASLGTALTPSQVQLIRRFAPAVHILYDADSAGVAAALRAADLAILGGLDCRIVRLPEGEDPDSLLQNEGAEALGSALAQHRSFVQFHMESAGINRSMGPTERIAAAGDLLETIRSLRNPMQADLLLQELADLTGIRRDALDKAAAARRPRAVEENSAAHTAQIAVAPEQVPERDLIQALLRHPEYTGDCLEEVSAEMITQPDLHRIFLALERHHITGEPFEPAALTDQFTNPQVRSFIAQAVVNDSDAQPERLREEVRECARLLRLRALTRQKSEIEERIDLARREKRPYLQLMESMAALQRQIHDSGHRQAG